MEDNDIVLHVEWKWLKYDIDQETFKSAKCLITDDPSNEITTEAQTASSTFDKDYCKRKIVEGCGKLQDTLHKFFGGLVIKNGETEIVTDASDTLLTEATKWIFTFTNLGDRRKIDDKLLASEVHQYLVLYVLQEWSKLTHPKMEENYIARLVAEETRIKSIVYRKEESTRPE